MKNRIVRPPLQLTPTYLSQLKLDEKFDSIITHHAKQIKTN